MSDADTLLAHLVEHRGPGGVYDRNLNTAAAEIGWVPAHLSEVMQQLVADGRVEPAHANGDPAKVFGSQWRILEDATPAADGDELTGLGLKELRALAKDRDVDVKGLKKKDELIGALRGADAEPVAGDEPVDLLSELDSKELAAFAEEHSIELPAHSLDDPDTKPTEPELRYAIQSVLDIRALDDAANGRTAGDDA